MTAKTITLLFIAAILIIIAVVDTVWATDGILGNTISEVTLKWWTRHMLGGAAVLVGIGIIIGHLFWPQPVVLK